MTLHDMFPQSAEQILSYHKSEVVSGGFLKEIPTMNADGIDKITCTQHIQRHSIIIRLQSAYLLNKHNEYYRLFLIVEKASGFLSTNLKFKL